MKPVWIFVLLWMAWAGLLLASFAAGATGDPWWQTARLDFRMGSCLMLVAAGWAGWWQRRRLAPAGGLAWIALGMTLGFYGDSHVAARLWWPPFPHPILGGIVFFGLGHLAYIAGCLSFRRQYSIRLGWSWWRPILIWQAIALLIWASIALTATREQELRIPTLFYTLLVAGTPGFTASLAVHERRYVAMAVGGALFFVSDILLATHLFHGAFAGIDPLTWICYGGGQMMIVYGAILVIGSQNDPANVD